MCVCGSVCVSPPMSPLVHVHAGAQDGVAARRTGIAAGAAAPKGLAVSRHGHTEGCARGIL